MATSSWTTGLYHRSPVFFQNVMASVYGYKKNRYRFAHPKAQHWSEFYQSTKTWSEERLCEYQWSELKRTLKHAEQTVPFYRDRFRDCGVSADDIKSPEDMARIPYVTKSDIADHGRSMISELYGDDEVESHPTSGSTGMPMNLYCDRESMARNFAFRWAECRLGIKRNTRYANFTGLELVNPSLDSPPFWRMNYASNQRLYSVFHMNDDTMPSYIEDLNRFRPSWIYSYPSALFNLAEFMERSGLRYEHALQGIITSSEQCFAPMRRKIEEVFNTKVWDEYGQAELVCVAFQCECGKLHEKRNFSFVEFIPTGETEDGCDICEIVGTSTINHAWPLIRFKTGDMALMDPNAKCPFGRPGRIIERIGGRASQFLVLKDGRRIATISTIVKKCRNIRSCQAVQTKPGEVILRVVPNPQFDKQHDADLLISQFRTRFGDESKVDLRIEYADEPVLTSSGKFLMVVSSVGKQAVAN